MAKNWIQSAIKHPGALHKQLGVPQGEKIPAGKLKAAASKGGTLGRRARLAETLKSMHSHLPEGVDLTPKGDIGAHRAYEAYEQKTFKDCQTMTAARAGWSSNAVREDRQKDFKGKGA